MNSKIIILYVCITATATLCAQDLVYDPAVQAAVEANRNALIAGDTAKLERMTQQINQLNQQISQLGTVIVTEQKTLNETQTIRVRNGDPSLFQTNVNTPILRSEKPKTAEEVAGTLTGTAKVDAAYENYVADNKTAVEKREQLTVEIQNLGTRVNLAQTDADVQKSQAAIAATAAALDAEQNKEQQAVNQMVAEQINVQNERWKNEDKDYEDLKKAMDTSNMKYVPVDFEKALEQAKKETIQK